MHLDHRAVRIPFGSRVVRPCPTPSGTRRDRRPAARESSGAALGGPASASWLVLSVLAAVACLAGCTSELTPEAKALLHDAAAAYEDGEQSQVVALSSEFLKRFSRSDHVDEAYYLRGVARYHLQEAGPVGRIVLARLSVRRRWDKAMNALLAWTADAPVEP